jgi:hypothetical protein
MKEEKREGKNEWSEGRKGKERGKEEFSFT